MKKTIVILILLILSKLSYSQFTQISSGTSANINSIEYREGQIFFLGHNYLSKTSDFGKNLIQLNFPSQLPFNYSLNVVDTTELYLISGFHTNYQYQINRSLDGGISWTTIFDTIGTPIHDLTISENGHLLAVGNWGNVFKSIDGNTWSVSNANNITIIWKCISLSDSIFILGGFEYAGQSNDFGNTWNTTYFNQSHSSSILSVASDTIYMSSYFWNGWESFFSKSFDGGISWTTSSIGTDIGIFDLEFESINHGYAVGYNYNDSVGIIMETNDGGDTWSTHATNYNSELLAVDLIEDSLLFISGTNGLILKTNLISLGTGKNPDKELPKLNIFPNPANSNSTLSVTIDRPGNYKLKVVDINGHTLKELTFRNQTKIKIQIAGTYIFKVSDENSMSRTIKVIIKN